MSGLSVEMQGNSFTTISSSSCWPVVATKQGGGVTGGISGGFTEGVSVSESAQLANNSTPLFSQRFFRGPSLMGDANLFPKSK